jgi:hypothetical protein
MHSIESQDTTVNYGQMIRDWRKNVLGWKGVEAAVLLLNEALDEDKVSIRWWQRMEQKNAVPVDEKRRWIIQAILNIPPSYLGLTSLHASIASQEETPFPLQKEAVNLEAYQDRLPDLWRGAATRNPTTRIEIANRIAALEEALIYGGHQQRSQVRHLLCHYLLAAGNILRYQGYFVSSFTFLNKALALAQELDDDELRTKALYLYGFASFNRWTNRQNEEEYHPDLLKAVQAFDQASTLIKEATSGSVQLPASLTGAILADGGRARAYAAQDQRGRLDALNTIDRASRIVTASDFRHHPGYLLVDTEWVLMNKAEALLASGSPGSAIEELEPIYDGDPSARQRYLYAALIEAEAYIAKGWGEIGIGYLEQAIHALGEITSRRHLSHILLIHERLKQDERYKKSPEVARINVLLLKLQHPELFASGS